MTTNDNAVKCSRVSGPYLFVKISYSKLTFSYSKLTFFIRNSLFLFETHFSYSKLAFLTRNSLFLLETHFSYSKLTFLTRNSLFLLETHFSWERSTRDKRQVLYQGGYPKRGTEKEICIASSFRRNRRSVSPKGNFNKRVLVWYCRECAFLFILSIFIKYYLCLHVMERRSKCYLSVTCLFT